MTLIQGGLVQSVLTYENFSSSTGAGTDHVTMIDAAGITDIASFAAASASYVFKTDDTIRLTGASPVQRWVYRGGDKTNTASYSGPVLEGGATSVVRLESTIASAGNISIAHDDSNYFTTTVFNDSGGTTLDNISGLVERAPNIVGTLKILNPNNRPFTLGTALHPDTSPTLVFGWYKGNGSPIPYDTEQYLDYELKAGRLILYFRETSNVPFS